MATATRAEHRTPARRLGHIIATSVARVILAGAGAGAIIWAVAAAPAFWSERGLPEVAARIVSGETYSAGAMDALETQIAKGQTSLRPSVLGKVAILRLRRAESAIAAGDPQAMDARLSALAPTIDAALSNTPSDPFLWLALYWLSNVKDGFDPEHLRYLRMSYALGPSEGWIAVRRSRLALAIFSALPPDIAESAINEFVGLVDSWLSVAAVDLLAGPAWPIRHILLPRLADLKEPVRRDFAKMLFDRGLEDVPVPGVEPSSSRPWQH
jgi:hypothetical protein